MKKEKVILKEDKIPCIGDFLSEFSHWKWCSACYGCEAEIIRRSPVEHCDPLFFSIDLGRKINIISQREKGKRTRIRVLKSEKKDRLPLTIVLVFVIYTSGVSNR